MEQSKSMVYCLVLQDGSWIISVAGDFVEAPSKMLENWCWEPSVLTRMSSHFETKEPLSSELSAKIAQRYVGALSV